MADGTKARQINFRLPEADAQRLDALAAAEHRSTPDYVRSVIMRVCFPGAAARAASDRPDDVPTFFKPEKGGKR